jgi:hypothetical protein
MDGPREVAFEGAGNTDAAAVWYRDSVTPATAAAGCYRGPRPRSPWCMLSVMPLEAGLHCKVCTCNPWHVACAGDS